MSGVGLASLVAAHPAGAEPFEVSRSDAEWRGLLSPEQYSVLRQSGTERQVFQGMVEEDFAGFIKIVTDNRPNVEKPVEDLTEYAKSSYGGTFSGRVWSGRKAKQLGLVDDLGLLEDAVALARKMANAPNAATVMYSRPYGYGGSIYAANTTPMPRADTMTLELPGQSQILPSGMYYLWQPLQ